jgi:hypothetical protein
MDDINDRFVLTRDRMITPREIGYDVLRCDPK